MPRKTLFGMEHVKSVKRNGKTYLYFNTGQKVDGKTIYAPLGKAGTIEVGERYSAALRQRSRRDGSPTTMTVPTLVQRYGRSPEFTKKSAGTQKTYLVYLRRLEREFNTAAASAVEESDIYELMDDMAGKPAAVDMLLLSCGQMYAWARKRKYVAHNPFEKIDREEWEGRTYEPWPDDILEEALADPQLWLVVHLLYFTGQRIGDCCKILWDDVKAKIYVKQQKTGKELNIPIHSRLAAALERAPRSGATILTNPQGRKAKDQTIRGWIKAWGGERGLDLVPHGLRKNAVNALLEAECSVGQVSSITGQSLRIVELYALRRNNDLMGDAAMAKWERATNRETPGKIAQEMAE
jgi:integrase